MALSATKQWSQKQFNEDLASMGATDYYSVVGTQDELADDRRCVRASGVPKLGQSHPTHRLLKVTSLDAGPGLAERIVSVRYSWSPPATASAAGTSQQVKITWSPGVNTRSLDRDTHGNIMRNSAGDVFDPPAMEEVFFQTVEIVRYERSYNLVRSQRFVGAINSEPMYAGSVKFEKNTVRLIGVSPAETYTPGQSPIPISYRLEIRTPFAKDAGIIAQHPYRHWTADIGLRSMWKDTDGKFRSGDLYEKIGTVVGDRASEPVPLLNGAPINSAKYLVTSLGKAPATKSQLPTKDGPLYVEYGGIYWIGWKVLPERNLLELGL